jgi:serine/threonine-protein kinase
VSGTPIGTPLYMSPEQARGEKVDRRSDVYALGVLAFEMLTGQLPFVGDTTVAVLMAHIIQAAPHASEVAPLSPLLDAPLLRMLDKDPEKRPHSAGEAIAALRQAAIDAGLTLSDAALRLPKPELPLASDPPRSGEPDTLLDDMSPTARDAVQAASTGARARPLWPFGLGLIALGAILGFAVLRPSAPPQAEPAASGAAAPAVSAAPAAVTEAPSAPATAAAASTPVPSASAAASAAQATPRTPDAAKVKPTRTPSAARIPTDLENPF